MANIFVMGAGSFGTSLAVMAANHCNANVTLWARSEDKVAELNKKRENRLLPGILIPEPIKITNGFADLQNCDLVIIATPSSSIRETARRLVGIIDENTPVVCVAKGLEAGTHKTLTDIIEDELPKNPVIALSGPSHAEEIARDIPTTVVCASKDRKSAEMVQDILMNDILRIYVSDDILGVQLGGAFKNIIGLASGVVDGLGIGGDNTKAALMTSGITEIARLGIALGAKTETFGGLSGIGDLIVTCSSEHSRNRRCGVLIGQGMSADEAMKKIEMVVEGYPSTKVAHELAQEYRIYMPITERVYRVLYENEDPEKMIHELMALPKRHESETIWLLTK